MALARATDIQLAIRPTYPQMHQEPLVFGGQLAPPQAGPWCFDQNLVSRSKSPLIRFPEGFENESHLKTKRRLLTQRSPISIARSRPNRRPALLSDFDPTDLDLERT